MVKENNCLFSKKWTNLPIKPSVLGLLLTHIQKIFLE